MKRPSGFTLLEMVVVAAIVVVLFSILLPMLAKAKATAKTAQCQNNLKELGAALVLYQSFQGRTYNTFPDRLTHLYDLDYVPDLRLFVCPCDSTGAQPHQNLAQNTLKPGSPADNKSDWAERQITPYGNYDNDSRQRNCSYLYEFSTRLCQTYDRSDTDPENWSWNTDSGTWTSDFLVEWVDDGFGGSMPWNDGIFTPSPAHMNKFNWTDPTDPTTGWITWQEAKFWQMEQGDICCTGMWGPGSVPAYPTTWFQNTESPDMMIVPNGDLYPQHGYKDTWIPIVRCFWHITPALIDNESNLGVLNLAVGGNTFMSAPGWEQTAWEYGRDAGDDGSGN